MLDYISEGISAEIRSEILSTDSLRFPLGILTEILVNKNITENPLTFYWKFWIDLEILLEFLKKFVVFPPGSHSSSNSCWISLEILGRFLITAITAEILSGNRKLLKESHQTFFEIFLGGKVLR